MNDSPMDNDDGNGKSSTLASSSGATTSNSNTGSIAQSATATATSAASNTAMSTPQQSKKNQTVQPQKLELILNAEDGSLQTAPLLSVVTACTDSLYREIYDMAHGDMQIIGANSNNANAMDGTGDDETNNNNNNSINANVRRIDKMSNLSFAARRHELSYRLASHSKALTHVAALTASNNGTDTSANLARFVDVSTKALTHARTAWIQNDECQDALYFFHGRLFSLRAGPHDIYGALDFMATKSNVVSSNSALASTLTSASPLLSTTTATTTTATRSSFFYDLPSDLKLETDRYETSVEKQWSKQEVSDRWQMTVRRKLLLGEVGWMAARQQPQQNEYTNGNINTNDTTNNNTAIDNTRPVATLPNTTNRVPWKISLRGGIVRLMHGKPKKTIDNTTGKTKTLYPLEAVLTVLTTDNKNANANANTNANGNSNDQNDDDEAEWTLISVDVCAQAKTGQSNHQLDTTNKQRYNLHRLCALAMAREERETMIRRQKQKEEEQQLQQLEQQEPNNNNTESQTQNNLSQTQTLSLAPAVVARPLNALFRVAQYFSLSWQLEILSEQAKALSRGNWGSGEGGGIAAPSRARGNNTNPSSATSSLSASSPGYSIVVTPVKFFENRTSRILGVLSISFWAIDDRYGPPSMGDLVRLEDDDDEDGDDTNKPTNGMGGGGGGNYGNHGSENDSVSTVSRYVHSPAVTNRLTLSVRAEPDVGIKVSLSGADSIMEFSTNQDNGHVRSTIDDLMEATSNPFALSASEALLAATILCAERKCYAMVEALPSVLPSWISLRVEKGSIVVAAKIQYYTATTTTNTATPIISETIDAATATAPGVAQQTGTSSSAAKPILSSTKAVVLFRLACDSRTGSFVPTFSRSTPLLRYMACNDVRAASDTTLLRIANHPKHRRRSSSKSASAGALFGSGRGVRDAFDSMSRSMNVLGQRTGVGGTWKDHDDRSAFLRQRAIALACKDVNVSLMACCGMSVLYGLAPVAIGVATGIEASPEMAGGKLDLVTIQKAAAQVSIVDRKTISSFLLASPPSLMVDQKLVEHASWTSDGERMKRSLAEQERFGICCSVDKESGLILYGAEIKVELESPSSVPTRKAFAFVPFQDASVDNLSPDPSRTYVGDGGEGNPPAKRAKIGTDNGTATTSAIEETRDLIDEVEHFSTILANTIGI